MGPGLRRGDIVDVGATGTEPVLMLR